MRDFNDRQPAFAAFDWDLFDRYYAGDATGLERERIDAYLADHPAQHVVFDVLAREVRRYAAPTTSGVRTMLAAAHQRIAKTLTPGPSVRRPEYGRVEYAIAALLDAEDTGLPPEQIEALRKLIDSARENGR